MKKIPLIVLNSHPIQYFAPLHKALEEDGRFDLTVLFCSNHGVEATLDKGFGVVMKWDIPVLEGYKSVFLKNWAGESRTGFFRFFNPEIIKVLVNSPKGLLIVYGWDNLTSVLAIIFGRFFGHTVCMRCDIPVSREAKYYSPFKKLVRKIIFQYSLFPIINRFLFVGKQNRAFYEYYGVAAKQFVFTPFSVENARFSKCCVEDKKLAKIKVNLMPEKIIFLFSGKYMAIKRPIDLLEAWSKIEYENAMLVFMGDGELRAEMEAFIISHSLNNVVLTGFVNQSKVVDYYAAADVFVMCSELDAWGLSVNEAMNFNIPVVLSAGTCCHDDLLIDTQNGFLFQTGDVVEIANIFTKLLQMPLESRVLMGRKSKNLVQAYSFEQIISNLYQLGIGAI